MRRAPSGTRTGCSPRDGAFGESDYSFVEFDDFASDDFGTGSTYN